jgi:hypothetical protein
MIGGTSFTAPYCQDRLPLFSRFSRNTMKVNILGIIFSETKANENGFALESVQ